MLLSNPGPIPTDSLPDFLLRPVEVGCWFLRKWDVGFYLWFQIPGLQLPRDQKGLAR